MPLQKKNATRNLPIHAVHPGSQFVVTELDLEAKSVFVRFTKPPKWMTENSDIARSRIDLGEGHTSWLEVGKEYIVRNLTVYPVEKD